MRRYAKSFRLMTWKAPLLSLSLVLAACGDPEGAKPAPDKRGAPPPPPAAASSGAAPITCTRESLQDDQAKVFLPAKHDAYCLDPKEADQSFGKGTPQALEKIADLFDGESKNYEDYGVERVVHARYVAQAGGPTSIDVNASRFATDAAAYAMFTKRVVGDGDPADEATPKEAKAGGAAALGVGNAYLWRGPWLLEIVYNDDTATPDKLAKDSEKVLGSFVRVVGEKIPGDTNLPPVVALLPMPADRLPMGVRYRLDAAFPGLGGEPDHPAKDGVPGAVGYYTRDGKRFRVTVVKAADEAKAKEIFQRAAKNKGAAAVPGVGDEATKYEWTEGALTGSILVARKGDRVVAVYDELRVLRGGMPEADRAKLTFTAEEKQKALEEAVK